MESGTGALPRIVDAIAFAAHAHRMQRRKDADGMQCIDHSVTLVRILAVEAGILEADVLCAAALHDYLEDCCGRDGQPTLEQGRAQLRRRFGEHVLALAEAVTGDRSLPEAERKRLQVEHAPHLPAGAKLITLADMIASLRDLVEYPPADWPLSRRAAYFDWAAQVAAGLRGTHARLEALFDQVHALHPGQVMA